MPFNDLPNFVVFRPLFSPASSPWPLPVTLEVKKISLASLNVAKLAKITLEKITKSLIVKANVDFALFAMLLPSLWFLDADTAKMESTNVLRLVTRERNSANIVLQLVDSKINKIVKTTFFVRVIFWDR